MITFPVKIYVDYLTADNWGGVITSKKMCIYAINKINELRNYKSDYPIKIEDESPVQQVGRYVSLTILTPGLDDFVITLIDPNSDAFLYDEIARSIPHKDYYILSEIINYIKSNYEKLSKEVVLIQGEPDFLSRATIVPRA